MVFSTNRNLIIFWPTTSVKDSGTKKAALRAKAALPHPLHSKNQLPLRATPRPLMVPPPPPPPSPPTATLPLLQCRHVWRGSYGDFVRALPPNPPGPFDVRCALPSYTLPFLPQPTPSPPHCYPSSPAMPTCLAWFLWRFRAGSATESPGPVRRALRTPFLHSPILATTNPLSHFSPH